MVLNHKIYILLFVFLEIITLHVAAQNKIGLNQEDRVELLKAHNFVRKSSKLKPTAADMLRMYYDADLELLSKKWSEKCNFNHGFPSLDGTKFAAKTPFGQNLYASAGAKVNLTKSVLSWWSEYQYYTYDQMSCQSGRMCGHYTQVVWATTQFVGCWVNICPKLIDFDGPDAVFLVCNYFPAGNYLNEKPYKSGTACSSCPKDAPNCNSEVCDTAVACSAVTECSIDSNYKEQCLCPIDFYNKKTSSDARSGTGASLYRNAAMLVVGLIMHRA